MLVLETGIGRTKMRSTLDWLLSEPKLGNLPYRPRLVLSAGFAGACSRDFAWRCPSATDVCDAEGNIWPTSWPTRPLTGTWQPPLCRGRLVTVDRIAGTPAEKRSLAQQFGAAAVDMESSEVALRCAKKGVPFGCLPRISDDVDTALSPQLVALLSGGRVAPLKVLLALARRPRLTAELWRLATHAASGQCSARQSFGRGSHADSLLVDRAR